MKKLLLKANMLSAAAGMAVFSVCSPLMAEENTYAAVTKGYLNGTPVQSEITMYDANGNAVPIGDSVDQAADINNLKSTLTDADFENASKSAVFENTDDASQGIAKVSLDAVGNPPAQSYDVIFLLDESGSMNMGSVNNQLTVDSTKQQANTSPDLNLDHYYRIPAGYFGNEDDIYFRLVDLDSPVAFQYWNQDMDAWNLIAEKYNLTYTAYKTAESIMRKWQPWNNLYAKNADGTFTRITYEDLNLDGTQFCSPALGNTYACFDRMIIEKAQASILSQQIENSGADARIAVVGFNGSIRTTDTLYSTTTDEGKAAIAEQLNYTDGGGGTNYTAAFTEAKKILDNRSDQTRPSYIVFITDGAPYPSDADGAAIAASIYNTYQTTIQAIGINSGELASLQKVAHPVENARDCTTTAEFDQVINSISQTITNTSILTDTIDDNYELYVDEDHPITVNGIKYTSVSALTPDIKYDASTKMFTWNVPGADLPTGERLSFYEKLDTTKCSLGSANGTYPTNGNAALTYHQVTNGIADEDKVIDLEPYQISYDTGSVTAALTSDQMTNDDPAAVGKEVTDDNTVTYTIKVTNSSDMDMNNLVVKDYIPAGTLYDAIVSGDGTYSSTANAVVFTIVSLAAGQSTDVSFAVKVNGVAATETKETITNTFSYAWGTAEDYTSTDPQCAGNTLTNPTPQYAVSTASPVPENEEDQYTAPDTSDHSNAGTAAGVLGISLLSMILAILYKNKYSK